ncbi:hypothetical protein SERLA73DRAFT_149291 [Serpula lacrymans var. lacrymans S7.3]|uniref:Uncharacterized protein n=2 Tax=Serpula lacrymans var. lacrymans TaxID=341189 RepID=F8PHF2_SERL3|nr:uncharacterized protein SERLADRAFT_404802 [Serpula lacrymans var. lacrymans S7.9]EGO04998.1 hypothetical protein SERLA73DRAFT_149291 [Serpula lacrymans var. lacrymans S7.3]EGO30784.1 hypothetical protein SERLADRAFT_404802 [Serpula lacrymans var. lacrymans S7.9]
MQVHFSHTQNNKSVDTEQSHFSDNQSSNSKYVDADIQAISLDIEIDDPDSDHESSEEAKNQDILTFSDPDSGGLDDDAIATNDNGEDDDEIIGNAGDLQGGGVNYSVNNSIQNYNTIGNSPTIQTDLQAKLLGEYK